MQLSKNKNRENTLINIFTKYNKKLKKEFREIDFMNFRVINVNKIRNKIKVLTKGLAKESQSWVKENIPEVYNQAFDVGKSYILDLSKISKLNPLTEIDKMKKLTTIDLVNSIHSIIITFDIFCYLSQKANEGLKQFQAFTSGAGFAIADEEAISEIISGAIAKGKRPGYANTLIKKYFSEQITTGNYIRVKNRTYTLKYYSRMVARTRMNETQTKGVLDSCKKHNNDLVQVSEHGTQCTICHDYESMVYSISGDNKNYPVLQEEPPYHPHCEHHLYPTSEEVLGVE